MNLFIYFKISITFYFISFESVFISFQFILLENARLTPDAMQCQNHKVHTVCSHWSTLLSVRVS